MSCYYDVQFITLVTKLQVDSDLNCLLAAHQHHEDMTTAEVAHESATQKPGKRHQTEITSQKLFWHSGEPS